MIAGKKFAAAVPDVHTSATGRRDALAKPRPKNPAERSSSEMCVAIGERSKASASGAEREPEQRTASRTPASWSAVANRSAQARLIAPGARSGSAPSAAGAPASAERIPARRVSDSVARDGIENPFHLELGLVPLELGIGAFDDPGAREEAGAPSPQGERSNADREITLSPAVQPAHRPCVPAAAAGLDPVDPGLGLGPRPTRDRG